MSVQSGPSPKIGPFNLAYTRNLVRSVCSLSIFWHDPEKNYKAVELPIEVVSERLLYLASKQFIWTDLSPELQLNTAGGLQKKFEPRIDHF